MPTYEFRCPNGHQFEKFYKTISAAPAELPCTKCKEIASRQLSGGAGLVFKGSGFYLTDYGKNAHRKSGPSAGSSGGGTASDSKSDTPKADSAPAKTEAKSDAGAAKSDAAKPTDGGKTKKPSPRSSPKSE